MLHFTCDQCGKELRPGAEDRYVVKIEAHMAEDEPALTEADLDDDHLQEVSEILRDLGDGAADLEASNKHFRFDLCQECHKRFVQDPLGKESTHKLFFSKN
jgi:hypothetical protein